MCVATPESCTKCGSTDDLYEFREMTEDEKLSDIVRSDEEPKEEYERPEERSWRL